MYLRMCWKLTLLELLGSLAALVFFAPTIRSAFTAPGVTILEHSDHNTIMELVLASYQIEREQGTTSYSTISVNAPGWTTRRDEQAGSAALPVLEYRLPATANTALPTLHVLEQETENQTLASPLFNDGTDSLNNANVRAYLDTSDGSPMIVIQWCPFAYSSSSHQLRVQRRLKIQIED